MIDTPIVDFVKSYAKSKSIRLHMPGHKGKDILGAESFDITEIDGADVLHTPNGIISKSMENATSLFGSYKTLYSASGSSDSIRAMVYLTKLYALNNGEKPKILAFRNVHKTFVSACALLDVEVKYLSFTNYISLPKLNLEELKKEVVDFHPTAVYVTSPDYLGNMIDIKKVKDVLKGTSCLLIVDNAHGAYLKFLEKSQHPVDLGADLVCDSAHKTLPALTGAAYLHISKQAPEIFKEKAIDAMSLFASTSPSYLVLQSLDMVNKYIFNGYKEKLALFIEKTNKIKQKLTDKGYEFIGDEPLKWAIKTKNIGYLGTELNEILKENNIISEFYDPDFLVLMFTPEVKDNELKVLEKVLMNVKFREPILTLPPLLTPLKTAMAPKDVLYKQTERVSIKEAEGRIMAELNVSCPPAVPVIMSGEVINGDAVKLLEYYDIKLCKVVKE